MAEALFSRDTPSQELTYREKLKNTMLKKTGRMRGDMPAGPVDGSAREVITNCWELEVMSQNSDNDTLFFAVPRQVANNMRVIRVGTDVETGMPTSTYVEDCLRDGDYMIAVRPPSLWHGNVQPVKIVLWDRECFGLAPSLCADFHADFDGDEMELFFIGTSEAVAECKLWKRLSPNVFQEAIKSLRLPKSIDRGEVNVVTRFMQHSTMSVRELMDGRRMPAISKAARMKEDMVNMLVQRVRDPDSVAARYIDESKRGIRDVMNQQLFQGVVGDMLRQASIAASCVTYKGQGLYHVMAGSSVVEITDPTIDYPLYSVQYPLGGNSCMRALRTICARAQQAALDSHRVSTSAKPKLDLIKNMVSGSDVTLVVLSRGPPPEAEMVYSSSDENNVMYCVSHVDAIRPLARRVVASYNPTVLRAVEIIGGDSLAVCKKGISVVCNYYGISLDDLELSSAAVLMCYGLGASNEPATTKRGMLQRSMRWLAVVFANHYGKTKSLHIQGLTRHYVHPQTATEASAFCNFDYLT
ncbi:hypothetical protein HIM_11633 [Hirsutella minnesotensis 3608]|uniref:DNA-directed RNA polymerase n=1 Tax=Hirsutella minnesotensis 3608 TaxID=1043627 RepID=A0A0F7ZFE0_9HYPO|nr:hypothetical protein HIM_11633 [Hirsutella minnesotensis 3608]